VVTGHLTGRDVLRRHGYIKVLADSHSCTKYGTEEETSVHVLC